jgi:hypothetical protein
MFSSAPPQQLHVTDVLYSSIRVIITSSLADNASLISSRGPDVRRLIGHLPLPPAFQSPNPTNVNVLPGGAIMSQISLMALRLWT